MWHPPRQIFVADINFVQHLIHYKEEIYDRESVVLTQEQIDEFSEVLKILARGQFDDCILVHHGEIMVDDGGVFVEFSLHSLRYRSLTVEYGVTDDIVFITRAYYSMSLLH